MEVDVKIHHIDTASSTQVVGSNNLQHPWCHKLLNPTACLGMQVVGSNNLYLYDVDVMALRSRFPTKKISDVDIRRRTSTYVDVRRLTSTYVEVRRRTWTYADVRGRTSTYIDVRRRTSTYVHVRPRTSTYVNQIFEVGYVAAGRFRH